MRLAIAHMSNDREYSFQSVSVFFVYVRTCWVLMMMLWARERERERSLYLERSLSIIYIYIYICEVLLCGVGVVGHTALDTSLAPPLLDFSVLVTYGLIFFVFSIFEECFGRCVCVGFTFYLVSQQNKTNLLSIPLYLILKLPVAVPRAPLADY